MDTITRKAYAKVNLSLDVLGTRPDGYHTVKMILQTIGLHDVLTFSRKKEPGVALILEGEPIPDFSVGDDNLIVRAANLMLTKAGLAGSPDTGVEIRLRKQIPIAAGLAGGSSDAAATLLGVNDLFGLSFSIEQLQEIGVMLGADVPYCLLGGAALAEGIGEILTPLPDIKTAPVLLAHPRIFVSTPSVYQALPDKLPFHPDVDGMVQAFYAGDMQGITDRLGNVLECVTIAEHPEIDTIKQTMRQEGAAKSLMSGSGPSVFGIFAEKERAFAAADVLRRQGVQDVYVTEWVSGRDTHEQRSSTASYDG